MSDLDSLDNLQKYSVVQPTFAGSPSTNRISNITTNAPHTAGAATELGTGGRCNLRKWLGKTFRVVITDGRVLVGFFNCTDKDANVVLSMCAEYLEEGKDARILGNVMIPGKHIVSIAVDTPKEDAAPPPPLLVNEKLNKVALETTH